MEWPPSHLICLSAPIPFTLTSISSVRTVREVQRYISTLERENDDPGYILQVCVWVRAECTDIQLYIRSYLHYWFVSLFAVASAIAGCKRLLLFTYPHGGEKIKKILWILYNISRSSAAPWSRMNPAFILCPALIFLLRRPHGPVHLLVLIRAIWYVSAKSSSAV